MIELARRRVADFPKQRSYRHVAIVTRGGCVLSVGVNSGVHHAEMVALWELFPANRKGVTVMSLRIRKDGSLAMAKPCPACTRNMREYGVKKVVYSISDGTLVKERI
jgi:deoxycytidylate deaminase